MEDITPKWYSSSADPAKVSATIKGIGLWIIPGAIFLAQRYNISIAETDLAQFVDAVSMAAASVLVVFGLLRKIFITLSRPR